MSLKTLENKDENYSLKIVGKELINHDVYKYTVELPSEDHVLGTKSGQHFYVIANLNNEEVKKKYTPTTLENEKGKFEFIVKIYRPNEQYPLGGRMTQYLESLNIGQHIKIQGPIGRCTHLHNGVFELKTDKDSPKQVKYVKNLGLIAGGSGITPFLQIIKTICADENDNTKISLIFANHTEDDIICREELDLLQEKNSNKLKVWYTISRSIKPNWNYSIGYVNKDIFSDHLPAPSQDTLIMVCGPKPMVWQTTIPTLQNMGYSNDMIFKY